MSSPVEFIAENFVPPNILTYLGHVNDIASPKAVIKSQASDFQVEERQRELLCTVSQKSDLIEPLDITQIDSNLWEITVAKIQMTTFAVRQELARLLGVEAKDVTYGGLKDRWGRTAQRFTVRCTKKQLLQALSMRRPQELTNGRAGWFIKDPTPTNAHMRKGQLEGNRFTLRVLMPGMSAKQIEGYLQPLIDHLSENGNLIPNAYGRQRLGRRQNLLAVGKKLIEEGPALPSRCSSPTRRPTSRLSPRRFALSSRNCGTRRLSKRSRRGSRSRCSTSSSSQCARAWSRCVAAST